MERSGKKCAGRARPRKTLLSRQSLRTHCLLRWFAHSVSGDDVPSRSRKDADDNLLDVHVPLRSPGDLPLKDQPGACVKTSLAPYRIVSQSRAGGKQSVAKYFSGLVFRSSFQVYQG